MTGERILPGIGLYAFWTAHSSGWNTQLDQDLLLLSALAQITVKSRVTPLPGAPTNGDIYIVPSNAGSHPNHIAIRDNGAWTYVVPKEGWQAWTQDADERVVWTGAAWELLDLENLPKLGIGTTADATNRLAVKSTAVLFDNVGNGIQARVNKNATGDTASVLFQVNYSSRAEFGLLGNDNFALRVSPNGTTFTFAMTVDRNTGGVSFDQHAKFSASVNYKAYIPLETWTKIPFNATDHNDQNAFNAGTNTFTAPQAGCYEFDIFLGCELNPAEGQASMNPMNPAYKWGAWKTDIMLYKNGVAMPSTVGHADNHSGSGTWYAAMRCFQKLAQGDVIEARVKFWGYDGYVTASDNHFYGARIP